jgi:hypothetical protein
MDHLAARLLHGSPWFWSSQSRCSVSGVKHYRLKLFFAAALALTLALKLLLNQREAPDPALFGETVASFLSRHGFESHLEKGFGQVLIQANAGKCRMLITEAAPQGWNRDAIELRSKPVGQLSYIFDGAIHKRVPFVAPMVDEYWTRVRIKMGLNPSRHPVLAVAASDDCSINALPWWELGTLS